MFPVIVTVFTILFSSFSFLFFFNATATTEIYTLSLHDALPISDRGCGGGDPRGAGDRGAGAGGGDLRAGRRVGHGAGENRSEEHTSELQSRRDLVCRLLLEKKKKKKEK